MASKSTSEISALNQSFSYVELDEEVRSLVEQHTCAIKSLMRRTTQDMIDIGWKLIEIKNTLGHGKFNSWLRSEIDLGEWTARKLMELSRKFKSVNFTDLEIAPSALYLIASKKAPESAVDEILNRARQGERITHSTAKEIVIYHTAKNKEQRDTHKESSCLNSQDLQDSPVLMSGGALSEVVTPINFSDTEIRRQSNALKEPMQSDNQLQADLLMRQCSKHSEGSISELEADTMRNGRTGVSAIHPGVLTTMRLSHAELSSELFDFKQELNLEHKQVTASSFQVGSIMCINTLEQESFGWAGQISEVQVKNGEVIRVTIDINTTLSQHIPNVSEDKRYP